MSDKKFINPNNARTEDQIRVMAQIDADGVCPFCIENLSNYHKNPILKDGKFWILTENQWPYEKVKHQLLAIYKTHIEHIHEMDPEAGKELVEMFQEETEKRNILGGGVAIRFGSNPLHGNYGSTVLHIHAHLVEPDLESLSETESWKFKFGQPKNYRKK